jgi:hypothetical protein
MPDYIPFVTSEDGAKIVRHLLHDSEMIRVPLPRADRLITLMHSPIAVWIDPLVDGMDNLDSRRDQPWFSFMKAFTNFEKIGDAGYHAKPNKLEVQEFVTKIMNACAAYNPAWITVPQLPLVNGSGRNKINRALALAAGNWKSSNGFAGKLILPLLFKHQNQVMGKIARNPKVKQAEWCYREAAADGLWVVDSSLADEDGSSRLRRRFRAIIDFHEELNERISSMTKIGGPYWGLNLVLWAKGLIDRPAIGVGSGYQYFLAGGSAQSAKTRLALSSLRRRVTTGLQFRGWLDSAISQLAVSHPARAEFVEIKRQFSLLNDPYQSKEQVVRFYKQWIALIAGAPKAGRSMALFQDLSTAYAFGKSLPEIPDERTARRPEAVAEPLMLSCL